MKRRSTFALCSVLLCAVVAAARGPAEPGCGTHLERGNEELYLHRQAERRFAGNRALRSKAIVAAAASTNRDYGDVAVIDDAGGAVSQRNDFNLNGQTLAFVPSAPDASRYRVQVSGASFDRAASDNGAKLDGLGDDDSRPVSLAFSFPYFGTSYHQIWVNSDGNLTFGAGDANSSDRSLGRMVGGAPRISPLFADLDPSSAQGPAGVRVFLGSDRAVITWSAVPVYSDYHDGTPETFQVRVFADGRIEFAYESVSIPDAITGIAPGGLKGDLALVSLASGPADEYTGAVADRFSASPAVDIATVAQKFYATHEDAYDYLVIYNAVGLPAAAGAVAYEVTVRNDRSGYGDRPVQSGADFGSKRRLQSVLNMGPLNQYPDDPNGFVGARGPTGDTVLTVLGHETGHLFLAFASVPDPNDPQGQPMLGRALVHWSFNFNSEASFLEGTRLEDNGENTSPRFRTSATVQGYSPLDQYLMGFRSPDEVPPTFLVTGSPYPANRFPQVGITFDGSRRNISVDDIVAAEGRRTPDYTVAQRRFRFGFILVTQAGQPPVAAQIAKVEKIRAAYDAFYSSAASDRAFADTGLKRAVQLSAFPAAGVLANADGTAAISLDAAADQPQTFTLATSSGAVRVPGSVTIPAGATRVSFTLHGVHEGVDDLIVTPADSSYETAVARIQVQADPAALSLQLITPDRAGATAGVALAPVQVRVLDLNRLPYSGVRIAAAASNGVLGSPTATTDENGIAALRWTPSIASGQLSLSIPGAPGAAVTVTLASRPTLTQNGVVNAASYAPGITPGSLAALFGSGLTGGQVLVNGIPATASYASDTQINFVVPSGTAGATATIAVDNPLGQSAPYPAAVHPISPGIFTGAGNAGAVLIAGTGLTTFDRAAHVGDTLEIYTTGLGMSPADPLPQVWIGNTAANVLSSTALLQFAGVYQINATVVPGTASGDQPIVVTVNGVSSNAARVRLE